MAIDVLVQCQTCHKAGRAAFAKAFGSCGACGGPLRIVDERPGANMPWFSREMIFDCSEGGRSTLDEIVADNAHDDEVLEFLRDEVLPLFLGESATYHGGAGGDTTFKREV